MDNSEDKNSIKLAADFVKTARSYSGKTQAELALLFGTSQMQIYRLENGIFSRGPTVDMLARIATACGKKLRLDLE